MNSALWGPRAAPNPKMALNKMYVEFNFRRVYFMPKWHIPKF
jgi:hypothetical protein